MAENTLQDIIDLAQAGSRPSKGPLERAGDQASAGQVLSALALALGGGAAASGGNPFRTSAATSTRTEQPSELADAMTRFRVKLLLAALQEGASPQTFKEFTERGPRPRGGLPRIAGMEQELAAIASRPGTTTSRSRVKSRGEGTSGFQEAMSVALPLLVLLQRSGLGEKLGIPGMGAGGSSDSLASIFGLGGGGTQTPNVIFDQGGFGQTEVPEGTFDAPASGNDAGFLPALINFFAGSG